MATPTVGQFILERLAEWGVKRIYGYPGDGINGLLGAFHEVGDRLEFIQARHEEIAAFAACAHAKFTGEVGVCLATSGPGRDPPAQRPLRRQARPPAGGGDRRPAGAHVARRRLPAGGRPRRAVQGRRAASSSRCCMVPAQAAHLIDRAMRDRAGDAARRPAIIVPNDVQEAPYEEPPRAHGVGALVARLRAAPRVVPARRRRCARAAEVLNAGERVAMLIGQGAMRRRAPRSIEVAELLGAGVAKALNGRAALPDDLPYVTGSIGLLGTKPSDDMMEGCDTLLMVGSSFPYSEWLPEPGPGARRADRHRRAGSSACATRWRSTSSATPPRRCAR